MKQNPADDGPGYIAGGTMIYGGQRALRASLPRLLGKQKIYHGTSKEAADKILKEGLDPAHGGSAKGGSAHVGDKNFIKNSTGYVHVTPHRRIASGFSHLYGTKAGVNPIGHTANMFKGMVLGTEGPGKIVTGALDYGDIKKAPFIPDPDLKGGFKTQQKIGVDKLGRGAMFRGLSVSKIAAYAKANPGRMARGAALALAGGAAVATGAGAFMKKKNEQQLSSRDTLAGIIALGETQQKWPTLREEEHRRQYVHAVTGGGIGGALLGRALHRKGGLAGLLAGAATGGLARKSLQGKIDSLEDKKLPLDASIVGRIPGAAAAIIGAAALGNLPRLGKAAEKVGVTMRTAKAARKLKKSGLTKMAPDDYTNVIHGPPVGLLKESRFASRLRAIAFGEEPPRGAHGVNPFKWGKQNRQLDKWIKKKDDENPSGVSYKDVTAKYKPVDGIGRIAAGATLGGMAAVGGTMGAAMAMAGKSRLARAVLNNPRFAAGTVAGAGATAGAYVAARKDLNDLAYRGRDGLQTLRDEAEQHGVDAKSVSTSAPVATSHREVASALKAQGVGFFKRHGYGLATHGVRNSRENAAFIPAGDKGVIVTPKMAAPLTIRHEDGHAKDYAHHGSEKGWGHVYGVDDQMSRVFAHRNKYLHGTMLPEERAWAHAKPVNEREKKVARAALDTYAAGGLFKQLSSRKELDEIRLGVMSAEKFDYSLQRLLKIAKQNGTPVDKIQQVGIRGLHLFPAGSRDRIGRMDTHTGAGRINSKAAYDRLLSKRGKMASLDGSELSSLDSIINLSYEDDPERKLIDGTVKGVAAAGGVGLAGAGAYLGYQRYKPQIKAGLNSAIDPIKAGVGRVGNYASGVGSEIGAAADRFSSLRGAGKGLFDSGAKVLGGLAQKVRGLRFSARDQLNEICFEADKGRVLRDTAIGAGSSLLIANGLLGAVGMATKKSMPTMSRMLKNAAVDGTKFLSPRWTMKTARAMPEGSRIVGDGMKGIVDPARAANFTKTHGMSPQDSMERGVGLLSGATSLVGGAMGGAATSSGWKKPERSFRSQLDAICFIDPRPRNDLGMFSGEEGGPNPQAIGMVYGQQQDAEQEQDAMRALYEKLKGKKNMKMSARQSLDEIRFAGGFVRVDDDPEAIYKQPGIGAHFKRNAATYISLPLALPSAGISVIGGRVVDGIREEGNILKTMNEPAQKRIKKNMRLSHRMMKSGNGDMALVPMSARETLNSILFDIREDKTGTPARRSKKGGDYKRHWSQLPSVKAKNPKKTAKKKCADCGDSPCSCHTYSAREALDTIRFARGWGVAPAIAAINEDATRGRLGYVNTKDAGAAGHLKRNAAQYGMAGLGGASGAVFGGHVGAGGTKQRLIGAGIGAAAGLLSGSSMDHSARIAASRQMIMARAPFDIARIKAEQARRVAAKRAALGS